ncbi:sulfurtransferase TusA family protein [Zwartia vadi]|uniref:sulfurtransferase TusA family protein n=1 Tax=Zwartia vadi TaxID=3058168 RepID=UPI0025B2EFB8|nr:sulfurtransferase TusA family protein [Zwartia vadi]MDN3988414.1 sulfurtransferase TusA family protein [Zwartia vadi]
MNVTGSMQGQQSIPSSYDETVDATGLACPLPILKAKKALATLSPGQVLRVITTDRGAVRDFQAFCKQTGNLLLAQVDETGSVTHYLERRLK